MLKPISLLIKVNPPLCRKTNIFVELIFRQIICRLSLQVKIVAYHREISALVGRYADVAEQADARVLKTLGVIPYRFKSGHQHHLFIRHLQQISKYKLCIVGSSPTVFHLLGDIAQLVRQKIILSVLNMRLWRNWQTRGSQTPLMATSFRFKSCQPHQRDFFLMPSEIRFSFQKI